MLPIFFVETKSHGNKSGPNSLPSFYLLPLNLFPTCTFVSLSYLFSFNFSLSLFYPFIFHHLVRSLLLSWNPGSENPVCVVRAPTQFCVFQSRKSRMVTVIFVHLISSNYWAERLVAWHSGRTSVSVQRIFAVLWSTCSWWVTTMWVNRLLQVSKPDQLSLSSFWGR